MKTAVENCRSSAHFALWLVIFMASTRSKRILMTEIHEVEAEQAFRVSNLMSCRLPCTASISMYTDQMSHLLGCESTIPSNNVFPLSGLPSLYSSWANREIVFRSTMYQPKHKICTKHSRLRFSRLCKHRGRSFLASSTFPVRK